MNNPAVAFNPAVALLMVRVIERSIILLAGLLLIYLGYRLFIAGVSGKASLKAKNGDRNFEFLNAAPGLFFCLFGFVLLSTMSFKTITVSLPTVEGAINVLLADALEEGKEHSTDGPLPEDAAKSTIGRLVVQDAMKEIFQAVSSQAEELDFDRKRLLADLYGIIYSRLGVNNPDLSPAKIFKPSRQ